MTRDRIVVAGVSGSGKSTVGEVLAQRLGVPFADGDDLHPPANVDKMRSGVALTDADRRPWLIEVARWLADRDAGVVACSALRRTHRDLLREHCPDLDVLLLDGDPDLLRERQSGRAQHFMPSTLMDSQLATFEALGPDEPGTTIDVAADVESIVAAFVAYRGASG